MDRPAFKAAVLDMDGVITQTAKVHARAWKRTFDDFLQRHGPREGESHRPFDPVADYRTYIDGKPRYDGVQSFLQARGIDLPWGDPADGPDEKTVCGIGNRKNQIFQQLLRQGGVEVYPDAVEQIDQWKRDGWKVAVISSSRNCETILKAAGLLDRFDAKVDGNDLERLHIKGKPAPDMFLHAAQQLGVQPREAIVVEDAIAGVEAGRQGSFGLVVGVARGRAGDDLIQAGADLVIDDLRKLQDVEQLCPEESRMQPSRPSAVENGDELAERLKDRRLALFLDYDGTLTPIVRRPEEATLSEEMRSLIHRLAERTPVAIISGRDLRDVQGMVQLEDLVYAGSHGFDIRGPNGLEMQHTEAQELLPELDKAERQLCERIETIEGARVERKRFAIAIHYREVADADVRRVERAVDEVVQRNPRLRKKGGKKIFELQPDVEWDKGRAVMWLASVLGLDGPDTLLMYIGDDVTDEDAFRALRDREGGIGIRVAAPEEPTEAAYYLRDCDEVRQFLQWLLTVLPEANFEHAPKAEE